MYSVWVGKGALNTVCFMTLEVVKEILEKHDLI